MATYVSPKHVLASVTTPTAMTASATSMPSSPEFAIQATPFEIRHRPAIGPLDTPDVKGYSPDNSRDRWAIAVGAIAVVAVACGVVSVTIAHHAKAPTAHEKPVEGLTIFAVFFVAALTIERLLEPLSNAILHKAEKQQQVDEAKTDAGQAILKLANDRKDYRRLVALGDDFKAGRIDTDQLHRELADLTAYDDQQVLKTAREAISQGGQKSSAATDTAINAALQRALYTAEEPTADDATAKVKRAAERAEELSVRELLRTTTFWVIATCLGMVVAAVMKLYFLNTVGITAGAAWEEILATGLIIGAGTKPLHDLVQMMSAKSGASEDAAA